MTTNKPMTINRIPPPPPMPPKGTEAEAEVSSQNQEARSSTTSGVELNHLENLNINEELSTANESEAINDDFYIGEKPHIQNSEPEILSAEQFFQGVFVPLHAMPAGVLRLESLPIKPHEMESARAASDAIYEIALETPMFRFLIEPSNIWVQRALVIAAYAVPKAQAVHLELRARQAQQAEVHNQGEDDEPETSKID